jgi:hypothetical protein
LISYDALTAYDAVVANEADTACATYDAVCANVTNDAVCASVTNDAVDALFAQDAVPFNDPVIPLLTVNEPLTVVVNRQPQYGSLMDRQLVLV